MTRPLSARTRLIILGATYGALWSLVAVALLLLMKEPLVRAAGRLAYFTPAGMLTGIAVTWSLRRRLQGARIIPALLTGPLALLAGTLVFAGLLGLLTLALDWRAGRPLNFHDSLIMLYWCPLVAFGAVFPVVLAMLNCWDLGRRLARLSPA